LKPGPKPKPYLAAVREGNPGHKALSPGLVLPPSTLVAPDWSDRLPGAAVDEERVRQDCAEVWARTADVLVRCAGLTVAQQDCLADFCVTTARIRQCERAISRDGLVVQTERGWVKNPHSTLLNQYRAHWRSLMGELGLSPASASRLVAPVEDEDGDVFD
jgi:P27 family predicted phage terminase small subunit